MTQMMDIENFWLVMAIDSTNIDGIIDLVTSFEGRGESDGFPVNLIGMTRPTVEAMHAEMAIVYPDWEVIGYWRLSDLIANSVDKLTAI